ncbi:MAG: RagB/SusD family nutrient uptake outer membrane protein, partial [Cytophagales bacterium]|nr:RagB/SusD family nutrient uptake outer membrane protein [Cytophagales bacterium]
MKTKFIALASLLLLATLPACKKDFLELAPQSEVSAVNFYKTADDVRAAVNGVYASLQSGDQYYGSLIFLLENRSDNVFDANPGGNAGREYSLDFFFETADNALLQRTWASFYNGIYRCNAVLSSIDAIAMDATLKEQYKAEMRFIRALNYFHLVRMWGDVPLVLTTITPLEAYKLGRTPTAEVYAAIEEDLRFAAATLPATYPPAEAGRATLGAAKSLLGKVYLTEKKFSAAAGILSEVVASGTYRLIDKVADVFSVGNENNAELIFAVRFSKTIAGEGHGLHPVYDILNLNLDPALLAAYAPTDQRRELLNTTRISGNIAAVNKFYDVPFNNTIYGNDFPVLRYADVLLMRAEALNEEGYSAGGEAFDRLNQVRTRAGATPYTAADLPDQARFREAVYLERRLELPLEQHRWYDLVRTGTAPAAIRKLGG